MVFSRKELLNAINKNVKDLQENLDMHSCLIASIIGKDIDTRNLSKFFESCPAKTNEKILKNAIKETIEVLDESKKSFKSKRLEELRKKLINILVEN